jgi:hypothetical protein
MGWRLCPRLHGVPRGFVCLLLFLALAGCGRTQVEGVYIGPAPVGPQPPGVSGSAAVHRPWLLFDRGGQVSRAAPRKLEDLDLAGAAAKGGTHVGRYRARRSRLTLEWPNGSEQHELEIAGDHLLLDGARWERVDGRAAGLPLIGRYQWSRTVPGIVSELTELSFGADGKYLSETRVVHFTPPAEPETLRRTGAYRRDGDLLHLSFDDGTRASVPFFVEVVDGTRVMGFWQAGIPFARVP